MGGRRSERLQRHGRALPGHSRHSSLGAPIVDDRAKPGHDNRQGSADCSWGASEMTFPRDASRIVASLAFIVSLTTDLVAQNKQSSSPFFAPCKLDHEGFSSTAACVDSLDFDQYIMASILKNLGKHQFDVFGSALSRTQMAHYHGFIRKDGLVYVNPLGTLYFLSLSTHHMNKEEMEKFKRENPNFDVNMSKLYCEYIRGFDLFPNSELRSRGESKDEITTASQMKSEMRKIQEKSTVKFECP
jgi:hypothetical protein